MDREIWTVLNSAVKRVARRLPRPRRRFDYNDRLILLMWLWSAMHERPLCWACARSSYSSLFRPRSLPSVSQFCKRLQSERFALARRMLHEVLVEQGLDDRICYLDGKALPVGEYSTDPDATDGRAHGRFRKGYKMHALTSERGFILQHTVLPLNVGEPNTARSLLDRFPAGALALADANYDSAPLYEAIRQRGGQLLTRLKGRARSADRLRTMGPARRQAIAMWETASSCCEVLLHWRDDIERHFGHLTSCGGGLTGLPAWVRRLDRVRRWVDAKVAIYHARLLVRRMRMAA